MTDTAQHTNNQPVVTRFAPSPSGNLHIGGARAALFCWAFAKRHQGRFLLRIEDTDAARSTEDAANAILEDLAWLGLTWDDGPTTHVHNTSAGGDDRSVGPFFQSQRRQTYNTYFNQLLEQGLAYPAFDTADELAAARDAAQAEKRTFRYTRDPAYDHDAAIERINAGEEHVLRLHVKQTSITVNDQVLGSIEFTTEHFDDFVIRKKDGLPTYHFAVVVDDSLMGVTHVLRGQEHLNNTPKHIALQHALGFDTPVYAHMPLIFNEKGAKMSKRERDVALKSACTTDQLPLDVVVAKYLDVIAPEIAHNYRAAKGSTLYRISDQLSFHDFKRMNDDGVLRHVFGGQLSDPSMAVYRSHIRTFRDWIISKGRQLQTRSVDEIDKALDLRLPQVSVKDFRRAGYLPQAINNYLALLGWTPNQAAREQLKQPDGQETDRFTKDFLAEHFELSGIGKTNARFDRQKLLAFNADTIQHRLSDNDFATHWRDWLDEFDPDTLERLINAVGREHWLNLAAAARPRAKTLADAHEPIAFVLLDDDAIEYEPKAVKKHLLKGDPPGIDNLATLRQHLADTPAWSEDPDALEADVKAFAETNQLNLGKVAQPLRIALTGTPVSPPLGLTLSLLGQPRTLTRIDRCLTHHKDQQANSS